MRVFKATAHSEMSGSGFRLIWFLCLTQRDLYTQLELCKLKILLNLVFLIGTDLGSRFQQLVVQREELIDYVFVFHFGSFEKFCYGENS
jgi:hypothetical protein